MIKNKRIALMAILIILIFSSFSTTEEIDKDSNSFMNKFIKEQLNSLDIKELELVLEDIVKGNENYFPNIDVRGIIKSLIKGETFLDLGSLLKEFSKSFFKEIIENLMLISQIIIISTACSILTNLQTTFEKDTVAQLAHYVCYIILSMLIINSFILALDLGRNTVIGMVNFMQVILPILLTLLTAVGGPNTKLLFHPIVIATVNIVGTLVKDFIFPLILFSFIVGIISNLSQKIQFSKLSGLIRHIIILIVSASLTVFIGIITMYGINAKVNGITMRTAKFAVDSFIPIIGKFLSDAVETVIGCSTILKNGIGFIGLITLFLICVMPAIKISVLLLVYKTAEALMQPIVSPNITNCFSEAGKAILLILIGVLSVAIMFFITITIIVEAGNTTLMLR